ncbi:alkylation response protein AidB-like acyl-CoA dehydrogenase [Tamaricihabitans halophyticus]|uniref:Alkylation response protein AidB-like acyl-CoA dehydrogenase n=1 Tax=Tamaricihabitans halophyticus TaxID=1262583 RepID=A0A4R2R186_9PSEU|nr:acyl-CoA dehydrogenase family protein [Tamaricihabitans halophyticus]TCP56432.1 alkylation response protein AidB-like acyl-CoA dehydrogenase [Tamaricihabitans halophyticus]
MRFATTVLTPAELELRAQVRDFLRTELPPEHKPGLGMAAEHDPEFSCKLAAAGWVGMAIPPKYGGRGRSVVDRFIVTEELLSAGAPIGAHFVADRQTAPVLLRYGSEAQREYFLPRICAGECWFSLGMSEPDSGSDLASVRTTARQVDGGWLVNGTKVWTSGAHKNHYFAVLCRTSPADGDRHEGLSQLIVDLSAAGVRISPIHFLNGAHHFNEVSLTDVFVPDGMVLGQLGSGWQQVTSELSYERAGPDRFLSVFTTFRHYLAELAQPPSPQAARAIGSLAAQFWTIRQLSLSVARALDEGRAMRAEPALVKDIGTRFEQRAIELLRSVAETELDPESDSMFARLLAEAVLTGPSFTLRGGTTEILRSVARKGLRG